MVEKTLTKIYQSIPLLREFPSRHVWIDYDREADVLYINLEKPQQATDSILRDNVLIRKRNGKIIGITILNASKFTPFRNFTNKGDRKKILKLKR